MTVPDMSLSVKELLLNHTRGIDSAITEYQEQYFEDQELQQYDDITELHQQKEQLQEELKRTESDHLDIQEELKELKRKEDVLRAKQELYDEQHTTDPKNPSNPPQNPLKP